MSLVTTGAENLTFYYKGQKYVVSEIYYKNTTAPIVGVYYTETTTSDPICIWKREDAPTPFDNTCTLIVTADSENQIWTWSVYKNYGTEEQEDITSSIQSTNPWLWRIDPDTGTYTKKIAAVQITDPPNSVTLADYVQYAGTYHIDVTYCRSKANPETKFPSNTYSCPDNFTIPVKWNFIDLTKGTADIRPTALINTGNPVKLISFTTYGSLEIKAVQDIIAEYTGDYTEDAYDTSKCYTLATTSMFSIDSCTKLDVQTEDGQDIYKTKVKVNNTAGYIILSKSNNNYVFRFDHRIGSNQTLDLKMGYTNEDPDFDTDRTIARQLYNWVINNTEGSQWQGSTSQSTVVDGFYKIELETSQVFDDDPIPDSTIDISYDELTNKISWLITKDDIDVANYAKSYHVAISGTTAESASYSNSFDITDTSFDCGALPDGTIIPNGTYDVSIYAISKTDETQTSETFTESIIIDVDSHTYNYKALKGTDDGIIPFAVYTPVKDCTFSNIQFLSLDNTTSTDNNVCIISSLNGTTQTKLGTLKCDSVTQYKKAAEDGSILYKHQHSLNSTTELSLTAGTTYIISLCNVQWGYNYIVWNEESTTSVKTAPAWSPTGTVSDSSYKCFCNINVE